MGPANDRSITNRFNEAYLGDINSAKKFTLAQPKFLFHLIAKYMMVLPSIGRGSIKHH